MVCFKGQANLKIEIGKSESFIIRKTSLGLRALS